MSSSNWRSRPPRPGVVGADVAEDLGGEIVVGVEALELFLDVNTAEVELADAVGGVGIEAAADPGEVAGGVEAGEDLRLRGEVILRVGVDDLGEELRGVGAVVAELGGDGVDRVDEDGHAELAEVAVVEDAAAGSDFKGALLLSGGASTKSEWRTT